MQVNIKLIYLCKLMLRYMDLTEAADATIARKYVTYRYRPIDAEHYLNLILQDSEFADKIIFKYVN